MIKKQALLFEQCNLGSQNEMLPSELQKTYHANEHSMMANSPAIVSVETPKFQPNMIHPSDPEFYSGSITQVLSNPNLNPALQSQILSQKVYPNAQTLVSSEKQKFVSKDKTKQDVSEQKEEEEDEEIISTNKASTSKCEKNETRLSKPTLAQHVSVGDIPSSLPESTADKQEIVKKEPQCQEIPVIEHKDLIKTKSWKDLTKEEDEDFE